MAVFIYGDPHGTRDLFQLMLFRENAGAHLTKDDYVIVEISKKEMIILRQYFRDDSDDGDPGMIRSLKGEGP